MHAIIGRDDMELVGVYAHGADKVDVDAAELAGLTGLSGPTGITATDDVDALIALAPDACCYNPLWPNVDELVRLLRAGVNVCSSAAWITGGKQSPADLERIRTACAAGNSTIFGSGAHPGMTNIIGMVLTGSCETWTRFGSPSRWTVRRTSPRARRRRWDSVETPTPLVSPKASGAKARCSPSRPR